jgi:hypothetical protein
MVRVFSKSFVTFVCFLKFDIVAAAADDDALLVGAHPLFSTF